MCQSHADSCAEVYEELGSIKGSEFFNQLSDYQLIKKELCSIKTGQFSRPEPLLFLSSSSSFTLIWAEWTPFQTH
jgi:hypothetical protein